MDPALVEAIPGATFILEAAGLGALFGTLFAYWWGVSDPAFDPWRTVAIWTLAGAGAAILAQVLSEVFS